jgi:hypothetical protein
MKYSNRWWKKKAIKALKKTIKKFEEPKGKVFNNVEECEFCKIYHDYWKCPICLGCPFNVGDSRKYQWNCLEFECYKEFTESIRCVQLYSGKIIYLTFKQKELVKKCVEVMEGILYILKKLPSWRFDPIDKTGFPELKELRKR